MISEQEWIDALGGEAKGDFVLQTFRKSPAMVAREPVNGHRMWTKYDPAVFDERVYELVPDMWDHEHCVICWDKILDGDGFWENGDGRILCEECHGEFLKRGEPGAG